MGFILSIIAYLLLSLLTPLGLLFGIFKKGYFFRLAISLDQLGNVICGELLNIVMIKKSISQFGNPDETISSVLGKNKLSGTLTSVGILTDVILNKLDDNHSINSIENDL